MYFFNDDSHIFFTFASSIFLTSNNLIYFIMKRKKYFFTRSTGFASDFVFDSLYSLKNALLEQFNKGYEGGGLFVHQIVECNIYYCGSVSFEEFENDFNNLVDYECIF